MDISLIKSECDQMSSGGGDVMKKLKHREPIVGPALNAGSNNSECPEANSKSALESGWKHCDL